MVGNGLMAIDHVATDDGLSVLALAGIFREGIGEVHRFHLVYRQPEQRFLRLGLKRAIGRHQSFVGCESR